MADAQIYIPLHKINKTAGWSKWGDLMKALLFVISAMLLLSACSNSAEKSSDEQPTFLAASSTASAAVKESDLQQNQPVSSAADADTADEWHPKREYWPEPLAVTEENLEPFADWVTPFPYEKPGHQLTDQEIVSGTVTLLSSGVRVLNWYRGDPVELQPDRFLSRFTQENGETWQPIARPATLAELEMLRKAVFSQRYYNNSLSHYDGFASFDGRLYRGEHMGGGVVSVWEMTNPVVLAKTAEVIVLDMGKVTQDDGESYTQPPCVLVRQGDYWVLDNWV